MPSIKQMFKCWVDAFTLIELLVVIAIIAILAGMLLPILARAREEARRSVCSNQMGQLGAAQQAYMSTNDDFWSFQEHSLQGNEYVYEDGTDIPIPERVLKDYSGHGGLQPVNTYGFATLRGSQFHNPNLSLSLLYPRWIDDINIFKCPSTGDQPIIGKWAPHNQGPVYTWFFSSTTPRFNTEYGDYTINAPSVNDSLGDPDWPLVKVTGFRNNDAHNTSYGYDDYKHPRHMSPGSARIADMRWSQDSYQDGVEHANHGQDGQNVLYWDGSVHFRDTNYASVDPQDNIYRHHAAPIGHYFGISKREFLQKADTVIIRTHGDSGIRREWWRD